MKVVQHNHITRDIKPLGQCPACDLYHDRHIPKKECVHEPARSEMTGLFRKKCKHCGVKVKPIWVEDK